MRISDWSSDVCSSVLYVVSFVTELLGHGQAGQGYAQTVSRRLVHLTVNQCHFVQNVGILHLVVEVVTLTSTLTHTGEHGITAEIGRASCRERGCQYV